MYRIKSDKRAQRSVERITRSLTECLDRKSLNEIGIVEIAKGAGVSRATFYRSFDTPLDVLDYLCESIAQEFETSSRNSTPMSEEDYAAYSIRFLIDHADKLKAIFRSGRMDLLEKAIRPRVEPMLPPAVMEFTETERDYLKYYFAAALRAILFVWYQHGCKETASELMEIFNKRRSI